MKITPEMLTRVRAWPPAIAAFTERFPGGLDITNEPDPDVVSRWVEVPTSVLLLALTVLTCKAYARFDADTRETWNAAATFPQAEVNSRREEYIAVHDAHRLACGLLLWRLLSDPSNIRPRFRR